MSSRWKIQLATGSSWATMMLLFMFLFDRSEWTTAEQWENGKMPLKIALTYACGIFLFGWFMWWQKKKQIKQAE